MHTVVLSTDSLVAGCALAPLLSRTSHRLAAAVLVGAADAAASLVGSLVSLTPGGLPIAAPAVLAIYGVYLIVVTRLAGRGLRAANEPGGQTTPARSAHLPTWMVLGALAAALSVDNLLAPGAAPAVIAAGVFSAALLLTGLAAGARISRGWSSPARGAWLGAGLVAVACLGVLG